MLKQLIRKNYGLEVKNMELITDHDDTKIYTVATRDQKYLMKIIPAYRTEEMTEEEGLLTQFLYDNGIKTAKLLKTKNGRFTAHDSDIKILLQDFIEGQVFHVNTAPNWYLDQSARILGQLQRVLSTYKKLPEGFGEGFVSKENINLEKKRRIVHFDSVKENMTEQQINYFKRRFRHFERISSFEFNMNNLTCSNSHGDFYVGQTICNNGEITIVDWESACYMPLCLEVIMSFSYASPDCGEGEINPMGFKKYLDDYMRYISLSNYDIAIMPYFYYHYLCLTSFWPPYDDLADDYLRIALLMDNLMDWLFDNVDVMSINLWSTSLI